jgi:hypothetical protein
MERINESVIIFGGTVSFILSCYLMIEYVALIYGFWTLVPAAIGQIILFVILASAFKNMGYTKYHNTFVTFDYRTYVDFLKNFVVKFKDFIIEEGEELMDWGYIGIGIIILMLFPLLLSIVGFAAFLLCFAVYFFLVTMVYIMALALAKASESGGYAKNTGRCVCPTCGTVFARPIYVCSCGHRYPSASTIELRPSIHGLTKTNCEYCGAKLPVSGDRRLLDAICPDCGGKISTQEGRPYLVTLAGSSGSGKTALAFSAMKALESTGKSEYPYGNAYSFRTPKTYSPPYVISVDASKKRKQYLALFDINGAYFSDSDDVGQQPQYGQENAIIITINPLSPDATLKDEKATNIFWQKYHSVSQTSLSDSIHVPLHVVVTHGDLEGDKADVKGYLESKGYGLIIKSLESNFRSVSYHICDARDPKEVAKVFSDAISGGNKALSGAFPKI